MLSMKPLPTLASLTPSFNRIQNTRVNKWFFKAEVKDTVQIRYKNVIQDIE